MKSPVTPLGLALAVLLACTPTDPAGDTGADTRVELWQGGERVAWNTASDATTLLDQIIAVEPEPFVLQFADCDLRIFAANDPALLDTVQPIASHDPASIGRGHPHVSFHGFHVGAADETMDHLFLNKAGDNHHVISGLTEHYAARPVAGRPGWCQQTLTHWWRRAGPQALEEAPVSLLLWSDADGDWLDDEDERFRWTLEP